MSIKRKVFKTEHFQKYSEHCCVPLCSASAKFNGILSFHAFPTHSDLRRQWLVNIRRDHFTITSHTRVCCRHFASDQLIEPTTLDGRRRLIKGAVPTLFEWNGYKVEPPRRSVWERTERRPELVPPDDQEEHSLTRDHDYCSVPEPSALDISASAAEDLSKDVETLRKEIQELRVQREFGLQRFAGSDTDIRFYTRFPSYDHLMAFWVLIEPCIYKMIRVSRAKSAANRNEEVLTPARTSTRQLLQPIDEFFLFLVVLSVGLKERDLAHRFNIHQSTPA
nr:THAP domain-containing protein 2-like [Maylandia zebra]